MSLNRITHCVLVNVSMCDNVDRFERWFGWPIAMHSFELEPILLVTVIITSRNKL